MNHETTALIHQNQGRYLIQVKDNQPLLLALCQQIALNEKMLGQLESFEKSKGRLQSRKTQFFSFADKPLNSRWKHSGLLSFVRLERTVEEIKTKQVSGGFLLCYQSVASVSGDSGRDYGDNSTALGN
ncbi:hypothetical protein WDW89_08425 [Deltaproteobacteria bacterium TL4]